jgi:CDP-paratose synthetase
MKILVTGATGFIGQNLVKLLLSKNYDIHCIVRENSDQSKIDSKAIIFEYNNNINSLVTYFNEQKFDGVIHLASLFLASHTQDDISNLISSNIKFGTELLEASKQSNIKWFINTGTFWQHYKNEEYNPVNLYAATKEAFESIAKFYTETSNLIFITLKLNDTFGPNDTRNKVFNLWNKIAKSGETGSATVMITGLSVGMQSVVLPLFVIAGIIGVSTYFSGLYGVGIAAVGMLATVGIW